MKRWCYFLFVVFVGLIFIGCSNSIENPDASLYYENFIILKKDYDSEPSPKPEPVTFEALEEYKERLKSHMKGDLNTGTDYTQGEFYNFLLSIGISQNEAKSCISRLNNYGNILVYYPLDNISDYGILYLETLEDGE